MLLVLLAAPLATAFPTWMPPIGYNTCPDLGCDADSPDLNEDSVLEVADAINAHPGLQKRFEYVILGDGWQATKRSSGKLEADPKRFPGGISALVTKIHKLGLKFGITTDRGPSTCAGLPGSEGFEVVDAMQFVEWGVDYVLVDSCSGPQVHDTAFQQFKTFYDVLTDLGKGKIFFAVGGDWTWYAPESVPQRLGDSWRVAPVIRTTADLKVAGDVISHVYGYVGPTKGWSDLGVLGSPKLTASQHRQLVNLAAIAGSPMIMSFNLRKLSKYDLETLTNEWIYAISQDPAGLGAERSGGGPNADAIPPVWSVHKCGIDGPPLDVMRQQFMLIPAKTSDGADGFQIMSEFLPGKCLGALSNQGLGCKAPGPKAQLFQVDCGAGETESCPDTTVWSFENGYLKSMADAKVLNGAPGPYATVDQVTCGNYKCHWSGIFLEQAYPADSAAGARQQWFYDPASKLLHSQVGVSDNGTCVQSAVPTPTNIWGKSVNGGTGYALFFTNNGDDVENVTCDTVKCFGPIHFPVPFPLYVKNLWDDAPPFVMQEPYNFTVTLEPGHSAVYLFSNVTITKPELQVRRSFITEELAEASLIPGQESSSPPLWAMGFGAGLVAFAVAGARWRREEEDLTGLTAPLAAA